VELLSLLHEAEQVANAALRSRAQEAESDITIRQARIMQALHDEPGASQTRLTELTKIDRSTLADIVRRLTAKGYATRKRTRQDARLYQVKLTSEGEKALKAASQWIAAAESEVIAEFPQTKHLVNGKK
jgi:DNA-binding MarR family transcriptional regulator